MAAFKGICIALMRPKLNEQVNHNKYLEIAQHSLMIIKLPASVAMICHLFWRNVGLTFEIIERWCPLVTNSCLHIDCE